MVWKLPLVVRQHQHRFVLLGAAFFCGLLIAGFHWLPLITPHATPLASSDSTSIPSGDAPTQPNPVFTKQPAWAQDFKSKTTSLDNNTWTALVGTIDNNNREQQYYTDSASNLRIEDGALKLIGSYNPNATSNKYQSARLETQQKKTFLYGRLDITAKLPKGSGTWPAIWLLPANNTYENMSPANTPDRYKNGGEIDVMEAVGFQPTVVYGVAHTLSDTTLHPDGTGSYNTISVPNNAASFNRYTLLWTPSSLTFEVNDTPYYTYTKQANADYKTWPFDQPFYMIINLALGGTWGGMDTEHFPGNGIDNKALPSSLDIQSIYYYPYVGK
jgi:beta-glucanase (GH16 family)